MGLMKKIKQKIKLFSCQRKIDSYKYVHIMFNDKFNKPFVDFLNTNFNPKEHLVLCKRWFSEHPFPIGDNVMEIQSLNCFNFNQADKVICHSLFDNELVDYLYSHQDILKQKAYWTIWGGDLYEAPRDEKNDFVRKNFKGYMLFANNDKQILLNKYTNVNSNNFYLLNKNLTSRYLLQQHHTPSMLF